MFIQVETPTGATWVFQPDVVPPSLAEIEHAEEAARHDAEKQAKETVDYGKGMPSSHCSICKHFQAPDACALVEGDIDPDDWCKLFEKEARGDAATTPRMHELDIARAIAGKQMSSPQQYENIWLFAMRITGTGASYRPELNEHVWRDPGLYLTGDFLDRCNGLPVIWEHPPGNELTQAEFEKRVIGSIMLPYLVEDEVWGVARIYDQDAAQMMRDRQLSTSPAVVFGDASVNETRKLEGGRTLLIEGEPSLVDHLAVCELGVWDRGGDPTGISLGDAPETAEGPAEDLPQEASRIDRVGRALDALTDLLSHI
ncbi:MAG TPA: hypothetical protein VGM38_02390 [Pseudolysinimonas sp.]|jgi:hypothetical protein